MTQTSAIINVMTAAARKASRKLIRDFGEVENLQVSKKGPADFVSAADLRAEKILHGELSHARPKFGFLMEEGGEIEGEDRANRWIIDPLDGTTNFLHGIPHFSITIAHEREGEILAGIVYEPLRDELFWAEKGAGAFVNDNRLRVSARTNIAEAVLATGFPRLGRSQPEFLPRLDTVLRRTAGVRRFGSAALDLAYVAAGRFDGFWEDGLAPWDLAAGLLLVREAGGLIGDPKGTGNPLETGNIIAANPNLFDAIGSLLQTADAQA